MISRYLSSPSINTDKVSHICSCLAKSKEFVFLRTICEKQKIEVLRVGVLLFGYITNLSIFLVLTLHQHMFSSLNFCRF